MAVDGVYCHKCFPLTFGPASNVKKILLHSLVRGFYIFPLIKASVYVLTSLLLLHRKQQTAWQGNRIPKFLVINMANMFLYFNRLLKRKETERRKKKFSGLKKTEVWKTY